VSGPDVEGLPSYFRDNPWVEILANRGQEDVADMVPLAPGASGNSAISTAEPAQVSPSPKSSQPSQAPSSQELRQLISSLTRLIQGQDQVAHAQASAQSQPMIMVIPVVIQVPMPYPWPVQAQGYEIGGHGGVLCTPRPNVDATMLNDGNWALRSRRSRVQIPAGPPPPPPQSAYLVHKPV